MPARRDLPHASTRRAAPRVAPGTVCAAIALLNAAPWLTARAQPAAPAPAPASAPSHTEPEPGLATLDGDPVSIALSPSPLARESFIAPAEASYLDASAAWPARVAPRADLAPGVTPAPNALGIVIPFTPPAGQRVVRLDITRTTNSEFVTDADRADAAALLGPNADDASFEGPGSIIVRFITATADEVPRRQDRADLYFTFVSAARSTPGATAELQRTWFAFYDAAKPKDAAPRPDRPVVLIVPGMFGTPEPIVNGLVNRLRLLGWPVLRMVCHPARFTEHTSIGINVQDPAPGMKAVADLLGGRAAECAYAAEAAFAHLAPLRPDLAQRPRAAIGFSGGAMAMPTIVARNPDAYRSVVFVAGGADFLLISERSNYASWIDALTTLWIGDATPEQARAAAASYLDQAPLDAYHTAGALRGKHMLVYYGNADRAVPTNLGELLWERLGRPTRWLEPHTHESIFLNLPSRYDDIIRFLGEPAAPNSNPNPDPLPADTQPSPAHQ